MRTRCTLTKKDSAVVLCCAVFVLAGFGAVGSTGRRRAKEAVCLSNLFEWGLIWKAYTEDHDGYFPERGDGMTLWPYVTRMYYENLNLLLCPEAAKTFFEGGRCPYAAWYLIDGDRQTVGSYCVNFWLSNADYPKFWRTPHTGAAPFVPVLLDGNWKDTEPEPYDAPPPSREWIQAMCWEPNINEMKRVCQYRHESMVNGVFLDLSGRKIGLKELWLLKWHRQWPEGTDHLPDWEVAAPWMANFKDY